MDGKKIRGWISKLTDWLRVERRLEQMRERCRQQCLEMEKKWEKLHEEALAARDGMRARCDQWEKMAEEQRERANQFEAKYGQTLEQLLELKALAKELEQRSEYFCRPSIVMRSEAEQARKNLERLLVLAGLDEKNPLWQVILSYADEHEQTERETALKPDMADTQRQYNAGRAASAYDFALALRDLYREAQLEARKRS
jgi:hypothetical protein